MNTNESALSCGCDPGIHHLCDNHRYAPIPLKMAFELSEILVEIEAYLDNHSDVDDGIANKPMRLYTDLAPYIDKLEEALAPLRRNYIE